MNQLLALFTLFALSGPPQQLPESASDREFSEHFGWIYNNLTGGISEAQRAGKPLMVVIRCPP